MPVADYFFFGATESQSDLSWFFVFWSSAFVFSITAVA
jgi:hypothetical protein